MIPLSAAWRAARRAALSKRYGGMAAFPSSASIPAKGGERLLFIACGVIAGITIAALWTEWRMHGANSALLASGGLLFALPYGLAGLWCRRRRLRRVRERDAFLAEL